MPKLSDRWYKQQLIAPPIPTSSRRLLDRSPAIGIAGGPSSADGHGVKVGDRWAAPSPVRLPPDIATSVPSCG